LNVSLAVSSVGFTAHHVILLAVFFGWDSMATWLFSFGICAGGAVWALIYERSKSIYSPWLSHLIVDTAIFAIGYDLVR
jgi:membrane protease YdiL (CAAX protease family)